MTVDRKSQCRQLTEKRIKKTVLKTFACLGFYQIRFNSTAVPSTEFALILTLQSVFVAVLR